MAAADRASGAGSGAASVAGRALRRNQRRAGALHLDLSRYERGFLTYLEQAPDAEALLRSA
ncbi:MAG: hypothetical protein CVT78_05355 [Alphaproteobacteria bacterium HGW-Alphaproteobacteria-17]|nr:MAG: hypothetical protein CVT78_05355 [Alphaproteobacteria bacterium HGW-Alphaproteobacteria-17]